MSLRLNKVQLAGNLTRDSEAIEIAGVVRGAKFGLAVDRRKFNPQIGRWENVPVWVDCEVWNAGEGGTLATRLLESFRKGSPVYLEGHLKFDSWQAESGIRTKLSVVVTDWRFIESKPRDEQGDADDSGYARPTPTPPRQAPTPPPTPPVPAPTPPTTPAPTPPAPPTPTPPTPSPQPVRTPKTPKPKKQTVGAEASSNGTNGHATPGDEDIPF